MSNTALPFLLMSRSSSSRVLRADLPRHDVDRHQGVVFLLHPSKGRAVRQKRAIQAFAGERIQAFRAAHLGS